MASLKDKVVVLTGASRGIGAAAARMLAEDGPTLILCARSADANAETKAAVEAIGATAETHGFDVSDEAAAKAFTRPAPSRRAQRSAPSRATTPGTAPGWLAGSFGAPLPALGEP